MRIRNAMMVAMLSALAASGQETRWHRLHRRWESPPNPARIEAATLVDAGGAEALSAAAFLPDGRIALAGFTLGPAFAPRGAPPRVVGPDGSPPEGRRDVWTEGRPPSPVADAEGRPLPRPPAFDEPDATPFVLVFDATLRRLEHAWRLPWGSGSVAALAVDGEHLLVLIEPGPTLAATLGRMPALSGGRMPGEGDRVLFRFSPDGLPRWWTDVPGGHVPALRVGQDGTAWVMGRRLAAVSREGQVRAGPELPGGSTVQAVAPTGRVAWGGDRNTRVRRGPWRQPYLRLLEADGAPLAQYYEWPAPWIGMPNLNLWADASIRAMDWSPDGSLLAIAAWSHGGNTVMARQPLDMFEAVPGDRLGFTAYGSGDLSAAHVVLLDTRTHRAVAHTHWLAYLVSANRVNSVHIRDLVLAGDGSVVIAGSSASGLIQTGGNLAEGMGGATLDRSGVAGPGGAYVAVFEPELNGLRLSSVLPAVGLAPIRAGHRQHLALAAGPRRALVVGGAVRAHNSGYDLRPLSPATRNAWQPDHAGDAGDGYAVLITWD